MSNSSEQQEQQEQQDKKKQAEQAESGLKQTDAKTDRDLTVFELIGSALAAAFGVQSSRNRERDFSRGRPSQFIIIGIVLTALFVLLVAGVVNLVLSSLT